MMTVKEVKVPPELNDVEVIINFYSYLYPEDPIPTTHCIYRPPPGGALLVSLLLNLIVATILDSVNHIHAAALRWTLFHEGRLKSNFNVRLFTRSKCHGPNSWDMNVISGVGLAISYGALSCIMIDIQVEGAVDEKTLDFERLASPPKGFLEVSLLAVTALGAGLLLKVCMSTYSLLCSRRVLTWSNNLLANAKAISVA